MRIIKIIIVLVLQAAVLLALYAIGHYKMFLGPLVLPLIAAGAQVAGQGINAVGQGTLNRKMREWQEKMYWTQRKNSLEDWQMQAKYNSPEGQMQRLKEAGLNPHLVYGQGADATMGQAPRAANVGPWNPEAIKFDLGRAAGEGIATYYDQQVKQAQVDNLEKQGVLLDTENKLKNADILETLARVPNIETNTELGKQSLEFKRATMQTMIDQMQANLQKTYANTLFTVHADERANQMQIQTLKKMAEEMLTLRKNRAKTDAEIKKIDAEIAHLNTINSMEAIKKKYMDLGVMPGDPVHWRALQLAAAKLQGKTMPWDTPAPRWKWGK